MHQLLLTASTGGVELDFPSWLRITHFINFIMMGFLIRSGWEVLASHPRLYWNNQCTPGSEWLKFTKDKVPTTPGAFTARDDQRTLSPLISLPGKAQIGLGRAWHALVTVIWIVNGLVYVSLLFLTGQWRRIVPTSWDIIPQAWESIQIYAGFQIPSIEHFQPYDALQQIMYFTVVFIVAPLMIATGPIMSPAFCGRFPGYVRLFRNRQTARSIHFLGMAFYCVFTVIHVALVFVVHPQYNIAHMMLNKPYNEVDAAQFAQAVTMLIGGIVFAVALWIFASYWSLRDLRFTQTFIWGLTQPIRNVLLDRITSRQVQKKVFTDADISPFHWVNTRPPSERESTEWNRLKEHEFVDYRLELGGLVKESKSLSIDDLKKLGKEVNITMHTCMQGWTGIAKWEGVRLRDVLALVEKTDDARYVMVTSFGHVGHTYDGRPTEPYYECLDISMAMEDETILAWGMNDKPLPDVYGGPLRLRADSMHGYKMVKWVQKIEWIKDYRDVGDGQGGSREDSGLQHFDARA